MGLFDKPEEPGRVDTHRLDALEARVQQLEATVALLTQHQAAGHPSLAQPVVGGLSADVLARVQSLKRDGKLIHAIKVYREATGQDLKDAKAAVEAL
jgi:ribosomal protein L7/L12